MKYFIRSNERLKSLLESVPRDDLKLLFERHKENSIRELVNVIRRDGSNDLVTYLLRMGYGISYCEVVSNVAKKIKVDYKPEILKSEIELEWLIVRHLVKQYFDSLNDDERANFEKQFSDLGEEFSNFYKTFFTGSAAVFLSLIQSFGVKFFLGILREIMTKLLVVSSAKIVTMGVSRLISLSIPFLNIIFIGWTMIDLAGPAYRKIIPTVFQIGLLRLEYGDNLK